LEHKAFYILILNMLAVDYFML